MGRKILSALRFGVQSEILDLPVMVATKEYIVLPKEAVRPKPRSLSMEQAGTVGVTYVTAWLCVIDAAGLSAGETLLVIGATGGVGSAAMQMLTR